MSTKQLSRDFTSGSIARALILLALPFMASNALQVFYSTIDMVIVGRYVGEAGVSAVSQSSQILNFATMLMLGFSSAGQVLISQALGAGKRREMNDTIGTLFVVIAALALFFTGAVILLRDPIMRLMKIPAEARDMAEEYLVICGAGLVFTAGYNLVSALLRAMGDAKRPLLFIAIASVTNLILDILFTGLLGWGVAGAAWATIIGQAVSFLFSLFYLFRRRAAFGFDFRRESFRPRGHLLKMIFSLGTPMAIQSGAINISMLYVNSMVNAIGVTASATFGVGCRIDDIINKISQGVQLAALPMISQNIAVKDHARAKRIVYGAWIFSLALTVFFMTMYLLLGEELFRLFSDKPDGYALASVFIRGILPMFPALAVMRGSSAFIQAIGNAKLSMVLALLDGVVLRIGLSYLFGVVLELGFYGFVLGYGLAAYGCAIPGLIYFLLGKWKNRKTLADAL